MDYVNLESTGLKVSRLYLGCMSFGDPAKGWHPWVLDEHASKPIISRAVEAGTTKAKPPTAVVDVLESLASGRQVPMSQIALAWLLAKPAITAPIVGVSKLAQLDAIKALDVELSEDDVSALEAPYVPHAVIGF